MIVAEIKEFLWFMIRSTLNLYNDDQTFGKGDTIFTVSKLRPNIIKEDLLVMKREEG